MGMVVDLNTEVIHRYVYELRFDLARCTGTELDELRRRSFPNGRNGILIESTLTIVSSLIVT